LQYHDQVADIRLRQIHPIRQQVERGAEWADHGRCFSGLAHDFVSNQHGIVFSQHLAEIARCREVVVQTAVGHEENLAAGNFAVDDAADVDSGLLHQKAAELDHKLRVR
jgi:hypothetical protein